MIEVLPCVTPTPPVLTCYDTRWYGIPRGTTGRNGNTIQGIVLHCLDTPLNAYDGHMAAKGLIPALSNHTSMHYAVNPDGIIHQYVLDTDIAWGSQQYLGNFPSSTPDTDYIGWPVLKAANPNKSLDLYAIHIGIASQAYGRQLDSCKDPCDVPHLGFTDVGYAQLVRLIAYLAQKHNIPVDGQHIAFHDTISVLPSQELGCACLENFCLVCDVDAYCEKCINPSDATYVLYDEIKYLYGENAAGCKVKIGLSDLKALLAGV